MATCLANSTMLRGFVKNCASAIDAFGNFVSALTDIPIRPLPSDAGLADGRGHDGEILVEARRCST